MRDVVGLRSVLPLPGGVLSSGLSAQSGILVTLGATGATGDGRVHAYNGLGGSDRYE